MKNEQFEELLEQAKINKTEFASLVEMNYTSVTNWNKSDNVPQWVKSWLENYIEMRKHEALKKAFIDSGICEQLSVINKI